MYELFEEWLNGYLEKGIPQEVVATNFNIYEETGNSWSVEIVGAGSFDEEDEDWACDEITDFGSRENLFTWEAEEEWEVVLENVIKIINEYLKKGKYANTLKGLTAVGTGFVDGDIEILYKK
jgi:shikimate kinase